MLKKDILHFSLLSNIYFIMNPFLREGLLILKIIKTTNIEKVNSNNEEQKPKVKKNKSTLNKSI